MTATRSAPPADVYIVPGRQLSGTREEVLAQIDEIGHGSASVPVLGRPNDSRARRRWRLDFCQADVRSIRVLRARFRAAASRGA